MKQNIELIKTLSAAFAPPGYEGPVNDIIKNEMKDFTTITTDLMNNMVIKLPNYEKEKPTLMIDCHTDEVGFLVQYIHKNGLLSISPVGGWFTPNVMGSNMWVGNMKGEWFFGVITSTPPHFLKDSEKNSIPPLSTLCLDIGARDDKEVFNIFSIEVGSPIVPFSPFHYDHKTDSVFSKALDNRLGCALMMETLFLFKETSLPFNIVGAASSQEEMGLRGAHITASIIKPQFALVLESAPADDIYPGIHSQTALGKGPQIRFKDSSILVNPKLVHWAKHIATENNIPLQIAVRETGGTNAGAIHLKNEGIPCLPLSIPTRYIHSHTSICKLQDYQNSLQLIKLLIENATEWIKL